MGIDIQTYRYRIGSFKPIFINCDKKNPIVDTQTNLASEIRFRNYLLVVTLVLWSLLFIPQPKLNFFGYKPPLYINSTYNQNEASYQQFYSMESCSFFIFHGINILACSTFTMITNFQSRYLNGNRRNGGIKISHWNKGPGYLQTKMPEINRVVDGIHPHILGISEANLHDTHDQNLAQLTDYTLHTCPTLSNSTLKTSRVVVYTHKSLVVKVRADLMCDNYSSIWLEVGLPHHKKFLVCQTYREWQLLNQSDRSSLAPSEQLARWVVFLEQWERALDTGLEVHVLGDLNINHCDWTDTSLPSTSQTTRLRPLISELFSRIFPLGVSQHVIGPTRHWPGQESTGLDHYYTNRPDKLSPVSTQNCGGSDHMLVFATRYSRTIKSTSRYIRKRSYKNFNSQVFVSAIRQVRWLDLYLCEDVNTAVQILSSKIVFILDTMAPLKTIQIRANYSPWLSKDTLNLMKERDKQQKVASVSKKREDWLKYKNLRNRINKKVESGRKKLAEK